VIVSGLQGLKVGRPTQAVSLRVGSEYSAKSVYLLTAFVLPNLTSYKPGRKNCKGNWKHKRKLQLPDPEYYKPSTIDVILRADVYTYLQRIGFRHGRLGELVANRTIFGWELTGTVSSDTYISGHIESFHIMADTDLSEELQKFWKLKELSVWQILSPEERYYEELFEATHERDGSGRYTVQLTAKEDMFLNLAKSRNGMFLKIEQRLGRHEALSSALLVAKLLQKVADGLHIEKEVLYACSDTRVVLAWIKAHPSMWVTFVANQVAAIQEIVPEDGWRYVTTQQNPADLATRGISVEDYKEESLW